MCTDCVQNGQAPLCARLVNVYLGADHLIFSGGLNFSSTPIF